MNERGKLLFYSFYLPRQVVERRNKASALSGHVFLGLDASRYSFQIGYPYFSESGTAAVLLLELDLRILVFGCRNVLQF